MGQTLERHPPTSSDYYPLRPRPLWRFLRLQPASFFLVNCYVFIEYVRPQSVWPVLDVLPWGLTALALSLVAVVVEGRLLNRPWTVIDSMLALFSCILILSSFTAVYPQAAYAGWELYFSWVLVFVLITSAVTTERRFFIFTLGFLLYSFKMSQHGFRSWMMNGFQFRDWGVTGGPGWFHNSGEFGIQMCVFLPLCVEFILALRNQWGRLTRYFFYLLPLTAVGSMVASSSRGALVGGAAVGLWWVVRSRRPIRAAAAIALVAAATWAIVPDEQKARFSTAGEDNTSTTRLDRWELGVEVAKERPLLGLGYNNWAPYFGGQLSHNIFIQALSELGYVGLVAFLGLIGATFLLNARTRRLTPAIPARPDFLRHMAYGLDGALIGYLVSGFFVTVLYYPYFWINLAMSVSVHLAARNRSRGRMKRPGLVPKTV